MPFPAPPLRTLAETAETLLIAVAGGAVFALIGFPAALVTGSLIAVAIAALMRRPVKVPVPLARVCYITVGILLGSVVTPETLHGLGAWPASIATLAVASLCIILFTATYLHTVHGWDRLSAFMASSPGSMAQTIALSSELGADLPAIAIVQTTRLLLLAAGIPGALALFGHSAPAIPLAGVTVAPFSLAEIAIVIVVSTASAFALWRLRFPGGILVGAMAGSSTLHGTGLIQATLPWWVGAAAILVLGAVIGSRFANTGFRLLLSYLGAALGSFAVSICIAAVFAVLTARLFGFPIANVAVAFAPGALDTMMVLALALHLDPVYVGAHHVARFIVVTLAVAIAARRMGKKEKG